MTSTIAKVVGKMTSTIAKVVGKKVSYYMSIK